jgi:glycosyltransferase involved in cell wall biosynthesis
MIIIHVINYFSVNHKYQEYYLAKEQLKQGHQVHFITSERMNPIYDYGNTVKNLYGERFISAGFCEEEGMFIHRLPVRMEKQARVWLKGLKKKVHEINPDVIICHGLAQIITVQVLNLSTKAKIIIDEHMVMNDYVNRPLNILMLRLFSFFFKKKILKKAHSIIGISDSSMLVLQKFYGIRSNKLRMIPLGVNTDIFKKDSQLRQKCRDRVQVKENELLITYTGKITPYKKVHLIIDALNDYDGPQKPVILLVGNISKDYTTTIESKIRSSKFRCIHISAIAHELLPEIYNATDIAVWPDNQTISTLDATACGVPIICSNFLTERYSHQNGIGVIPGSLISLRKALFKLIDNRKLSQSMGDNGVKYANQNLSWTNINSAILAE